MLPAMSSASKVVITAALTGVAATRKQCPAIPYTPVEIAEEALRAYEAGAAIVHIHGREDDGSASFRPELFSQIAEEVRSRCPVLLNWSTGAVGLSMEERVAPVRAVPPDMAALNMGSMNYAKYSPKTKQFYFDFVFQNPFVDITKCLEVLNEHGVRPELECFDTGHVQNARPLIDQGLLCPPYQFSLILGVLGGAPATTEQLVQMRRTLPDGASWQLIGIGTIQWKMVAAALSMGGNIRVGLEDNLYLGPGVMASSNGELVEKAVRMARDVGLEPATVEEARKILGLRETA
ncbi:MAG: 3-keto-5-aminohexanoate cleavage protein [Planctomycetota bacterium]|nr:3-keto-5-aminohexanoate cleavage protein [Planctomycetota bacterium]